jgi:hypothetical protein
MTKLDLCSQPFEKSIIVFNIIQAFLGYSPVWWVWVISAGAFPLGISFLNLVSFHCSAECSIRGKPAQCLLSVTTLEQTFVVGQVH